MKTKRIDLLIVLVLFANLMAAQNGYSLKFEDAFFMSVENPTSHSGSTAEVTRTFIVPAGCILEINSGCVEYVEANKIYSTTLKIGNEYQTKLENNKNWQPMDRLFR